jgi:hypothetical protein
MALAPDGERRTDVQAEKERVVDVGAGCGERASSEKLDELSKAVAKGINQESTVDRVSGDGDGEGGEEDGLRLHKIADGKLAREHARRWIPEDSGEDPDMRFHFQKRRSQPRHERRQCELAIVVYHPWRGSLTLRPQRISEPPSERTAIS